jgi:exodeoxyribonuclease-5
MMALPPITLAQSALENSAQQDEAFALFENWFTTPKGRQTFKLAGYAGTGKTTIAARRIIPYLQEAGVALTVNTFTGKAASVLAQKGVPNPGTIHSLIYQRVVDALGNVSWKRRSRIDANIIIIDEASMVSADIQRDIESYRVPVLYIGDNAQLPPVGANNGLMDAPDFQLTEIHRQAAKSPIIRLAQAIRKGNLDTLPLGAWGDDEVGHVSIAKGGFDPLAFDKIICGRNQTRHRYNAHKRRLLGRKDLIDVNDELICLKNDRNSSMRNGTIVRVLEVHDIGTDDACATTIDDSTGETYERQMMLTSSFGKEGNRNEWFETDSLPMDWANAITTHKFQGSQARRVAYVDEELYTIDRRRLRYTGVTRAEFDLHIAV